MRVVDSVCLLRPGQDAPYRGDLMPEQHLLENYRLENLHSQSMFCPCKVRVPNYAHPPWRELSLQSFLRKGVSLGYDGRIKT